MEEVVGVPVVRPRRVPGRAAVLGAVAVGGVAGAEARYLLGAVFPDAPGSWPWTTLTVNVSGCVLIGILLTVLTGQATPHPLLRPLLGTGLLGGYTTFSTWAVDVVALAEAGRFGAALGYLAGTPVLAVAGCALGVGAARRATGRGMGR